MEGSGGQNTVADGEDTDDATTTATPQKDGADSDQSDDAGTPAARDDEDLQSPPLDVDELPAH
jgi:hypothetical protein